MFSAPWKGEPSRRGARTNAAGARIPLPPNIRGPGDPGEEPPGAGQPAPPSQPRPARQASPTETSKSEGLQILLAVLLGTAALATAWAAYRGDLYSGDSLIRLNQSVQKTDQASQAFNAAQTVFVQDVNLFTQFAIASNREGEESIAAYIQTELMRPALRRQVEWWSETDDEVGTPFVKQDPHYVAPTDDERGRRLTAAAQEDFKSGRELDDTGDKYVLYTVLFAAALFLYGVASVASNRRVMLTSMGVGVALFLFGLVRMIGTTVDAPALL